ncbi:MAG: VOC family protein [Chloroflexi bacterium]|nr:VOC family protein [Chloroflexota bacterium]
MAARKKNGAKITGFNHVVLVTNDMDKTVRFYRDLLGLKVKATVGAAKRPPGLIGTRADDAWKRLYFLELPNGDTLAFVEFPKMDTGAEASYFSGVWPGKGRAVTRPQKMDHVALNVDSRKALVAVQRKLRAAGHTVSDVQDLGGSPFVKSIYVYDPNGIPLEIASWDVNNRVWAKRRRGDWFADPDPVPALRK